MWPSKHQNSVLFIFLISLFRTYFVVPLSSTRIRFPRFKSFVVSNKIFPFAKHKYSGYSRLLLHFRKNERVRLFSAGSSSLDKDAEAGNNDTKSAGEHDHDSFQNLGASLGANSSQLRLSNSISGKDRGVYTNESITKGDIILSIPLSSCIRDDMPPNWCNNLHFTSQTNVGSCDEDSPNHDNPSEWAMRLAANLLDLKLLSKLVGSNETESKIAARKEWLSLMPDPDYLRSTLPIHWTEEVVSKAKCVALELSIDTAFFSREEIVESLLSGMRKSGQFDKLFARSTSDLRTKCHNMLDIVQTRSCRVEGENRLTGCSSLRILAPMFDFINHASSLCEGEGFANAYFGLEGLSEGSLIEKDNLDDSGILVVRARRDINKDEEILIDYGNAARPAWRCLASYGFLPSGEDENVAELFLDGTLYEVGRDTIPLEMVQACNMLLSKEKTDVSVNQEAISPKSNSVHDDAALSPQAAIRIAQIATNIASQLSIEDSIVTKIKSDSCEDAAKDENLVSVSNKLATNLCWSQHKVLLACAANLHDYAAQ